MATDALHPSAVQGGPLARASAWCWYILLWGWFTFYCIFAVVQVVQKTRNPVQITSYTEEDGFVMPSIVLCSFGTYNLNSFTAQYPTRYGNSYQLTHKFADLLSDSAANYSYFNDHEDMQGQDVVGATDLITFTRGDLPYDTIEGSVNFTSPQLMGLVRSAAIIKPNPVEKYNDLNHTRWCVMWVPYRVTLDHPPEGTANPATDTGRESDRQLDSGQNFKVGINLAGVAILQDLAWQYVFRDPVRDENDNLQNIVNFPHVLYVKFVDFSGSRKQEWLADSACSQYLRNILCKGDPDGFQIVELNQWHELSLQKKVTAKLTGMQKLGWPWPGWPWSDESRQESTEYIVQSLASAPNYVRESDGNFSWMQTVTGDIEDFNRWSHSLVISMVRSTKLALHIVDVSAVYSFFGNIGGAYTLLTLCYGLLCSVKSPEIETEFAFPGVWAVKWLLGGGLNKVCKQCQVWPFRLSKSQNLRAGV